MPVSNKSIRPNDFSFTYSSTRIGKESDQAIDP
jgi:hypothetical protein